MDKKAQDDKYPSFFAQFGRHPIAGDDFSADGPMCQDDYEYFTGTGAYSDTGTRQDESESQE